MATKIEQWVIEQRAAGRSVSSVSIRLKATALARDMNINDFRGAPSWCFRFMKRRNLSIRTRTTVSQQLPKDYQEKLANFRAYCKNKITEKKIRPEHITNIDEIPLTFETGRPHRATYATICQWIVDAWAKVSLNCGLSFHEGRNHH